jgi:threonine dehydratase
MTSDTGVLADLTYSSIKMVYENIKPFIRKTPILKVDPYLTKKLGLGSLYLKLENQQITGAFKIRGALSAMLDVKGETVVAASAGNHALGVAYAAMILNKKAIIFLPKNTDEEKILRLKQMNADLKIEGENWDESDEFAQNYSKSKSLTYIHPFSNKRVIEGQGTIAIELIEELLDFDVVIAAVGGGGLISGLGAALKSYKPSIKVIGLEPTGAATLYNSLTENKIVTLDYLNTDAKTLAVKKTTEFNLSLCRDFVDQICLVDDDESTEAMKYMWKHFGIAVELSSALPVAALLNGKIDDLEGKNIVSIVCAAGDGLFTKAISRSA